MLIQDFHNFQVLSPAAVLILLHSGCMYVGMMLQVSVYEGMLTDLFHAFYGMHLHENWVFLHHLSH